MVSYMYVEVIGTDFGHKPFEFSPRIIRQSSYSICSFDTDFCYEYDGKIYEGKKGEILITLPNNYLYHGPSKNLKTGYINDWMHIVGQDFKELLTKYPLPFNKSFSVGKEFNPKKYFKKIEREFLNPKEGYEEIIECIIKELIIKIYRAYNKTYSNNENYENNIIKKIHNELVNHPEQKWELKNIANKSGYSVSRFCEIYKSTYKCSPIETVLNERIKMAKMLLSSGQVNVSATAKMCGFNNIYYFSKYFKKITGYTPSYYIENEI